MSFKTTVLNSHPTVVLFTQGCDNNVCISGFRCGLWWFAFVCLHFSFLIS